MRFSSIAVIAATALMLCSPLAATAATTVQPVEPVPGEPVVAAAARTPFEATKRVFVIEGARTASGAAAASIVLTRCGSAAASSS